MSNDVPRRAMPVSSLPVDAVAYMIEAEHGSVGILSSAWGSKTVTLAAESMYNALHGTDQPGPHTRAHIRNVS